MGGEIDTLLTDFEMLMAEGRKLGLLVNIAKCEVITDDEEVLQKISSIAPSIRHVKTASAMLLGAPIGGKESVDEVLAAKLQELLRLSCMTLLKN